MATVLNLLGYGLLLIGALAIGFFDEGRKAKLWFVVTGLGTGLMVLSIVLFSVGNVPAEGTGETSTPTSGRVTETLICENDISSISHFS